jgi:hypothetical protein
MESTYYIYSLYVLILLFISISIILSAKNDKLKNKLRISKKNNDDQKTIICSQSAEIALVNARLRKKVADKDKSISDLIEGIFADTRMLTKFVGENQRLRADHKNLLNRVETIVSPLPDRKEKETDAHFNQRCRQSVANKAAKYVKVADQITLKVISHD